MTPNITAKETARRLFFQSNMSRKQIAEATGVNIRTLFDWINQGDWLRAKDMVQNAPTFLVEQYYNQLTALNKTIAERTYSPYPTKDESEIMRRITTTLKAVKTKQTRSELVDVLTDFSAFAINHTPAIADQLQNVIGAYLEQLSGTGPAARLARIKSPRQAADAYQAHIKDMLEYDACETETPTEPTVPKLQEKEREKLEIAAGIKEPHPLPDFSKEPVEKDETQPRPFYGVAWVDYLAERGISPSELIGLMYESNTPQWLRPYKHAASNPFRLMQEFANRNIQPQFFKDHISSLQRPNAVSEAATLFRNYTYPNTLPDPIANTQPADNQQSHDPILQNISQQAA